MNHGVVYKFKLGNKINGSLFYCFEYFKFLRNFVDAKFYIVGIEAADLTLITDILSSKYNTTVDNIVPVTPVELYKTDLDKTLVLDIDTFTYCREFLTNQVHCFSNVGHPMLRYKNDRTVTYYGSYDYQNYDIFCYLKLNFSIFRELSGNGNGVFVSALDQTYIQNHVAKYEAQFQRPIILKKNYKGVGNLFDMIDAVHYVHTSQDTNNRIIPEAFYYGKDVTIDEVYQELDSIRLRYNDITANGLGNYTLTDSDVMIQAMLK